MTDRPSGADQSSGADQPSGPDRPPAPPLTDGEHPAAELLALLGRTHALAILYYLIRVEDRSWRFGELETELDISPSTLSARLDELADAGLVARTAYDEVPPRVEYEATEKARELNPVFERLYEWADEYWPEAEQAFETGETDEEAASETGETGEETASEPDRT